MWAPLVHLLPDHDRVLAPSLCHPSSIEADAAAVADRIDPEGPTVVVGHSRGGLVATALAERTPDLVSHLIVVNSPATVASRRRSSAELALGLPLVGAAAWAAMSDATARRGLESAFAEGVDVPDAFVADLRATGRRAFVAASRAIDHYVDELPLPQRLAALDIPVDVVLGRLDRRLDLGPYEAEPAPTPIFIDEAGHTPPWEAPAHLLSIIQTACARLGDDQGRRR